MIALRKWAPLVLSALLLGMSTPVEAELKTFEADGFYVMEGTDSPGVAADRAREDAIRSIVEEASVYVESLTVVKEGAVEEDVVRTLSSNVLQIQSSDITITATDNNELEFRCHVVALIDSDHVEEQLNDQSK